MRVIEGRQELGFSLQASEPGFVGGKAIRQHLDGDMAVEPGVTRAIDLAHATRADRREDFVRTKSGAGGERHQL